MISRAVELQLRQVSGTRPFVAALVDGAPVSLMVHSNASFPMMLTHDAAERVGLEVGAIERDDYGIAAVGRLGGRGRSSAVVGSLTVGDDVVRGLTASVFELPLEDHEEPVDGMLGIGWLRQRGVVVDLARRVLTPYGGPLVGTPLTHHPGWDAFVVDTLVDGRPARWVVSTVAGVLVDTAAAERLGLALGEPAAEDGGPTGTVVSSWHVATPWAVALGGLELDVVGAQVSDLYAYADKERGDDEHFAGFLGCDFLLRHGASVDFGRGVVALDGHRLEL